MRWEIVILMIISAQLVFAAEPVLHFSDIISGPKIGLNDSLGEGAIVTIWGNNLGSIQGISNVYFQDSTGTSYEPAYVYYWKNADGGLPGGPSDLYSRHKMQEIAFSIPSAAADGAGTIYVEVDGVVSNELDFTVRSGNIYFASGNGDNALGDGSWDNPWATLGYIQTWPPINDGATTKTSAGDIIYGIDVLEPNRILIRPDQCPEGTITHPVSLISYPGKFIKIRNDGGGGIVSYLDPKYFIFSKFDISVGDGTGITPFEGGRVIGNKITDEDSVGQCADGGSGAISGGGDQSGSKILGNYIHDFGCDTTSNQHHTTYFSVRGWGFDIEGFELAFNYLVDNWARMGIHFYDEHACWGYTTPVLIHHNWVENQVGPSINFGAWACDDNYDVSGDFEVNNNVFIEGGQLGASNTGIQSVQIQGDNLDTNINFYNNLIYGYGYEGASLSSDESGVYISHGSHSFGEYSGTYTWHNNIVVDTHNFPFQGTSSNHPAYSTGNNIWYDAEGTYDQPVWDSSWSGVTSDPLFTDPENGDFTLQPTSPVIDAGADLSGIVDNDILGTSRPQGDGYDIGAYEYVSDASGVLFEDSFESYSSRDDFDPPWEYSRYNQGGYWPITDGTDGYPTLSTTVSNTGSNSLELVLKTDTTNANARANVGYDPADNPDFNAFEEQEELYIQFNLMFEEGSEIPEENRIHLFLLYAGDFNSPTQTDMTIYMDKNTDNLGIQGRAYFQDGSDELYINNEPWNGGYGAWADLENFPSYTNNKWYKVKLHVKMNTFTEESVNKDGVFQYWVDDVLYIDHNQSVFRGSEFKDIKWNGFMFSHNTPSDLTKLSFEQSVYFDDVVVSIEDIGVSESVGPYHPADLNENGIIENSEMYVYINKWKIGEIDHSEIINAIEIWKYG